MKLLEKKGKTSKIVHLFIQDSSKSDGSGLTGLVFNSAGLTAYYIREGDASTTVISLVTATVGTYVSGGFKEVDAANMPGIYEFDPPNACLATGTDQVVIMLNGASNMAPLPIEIQLRDNTEKDIYDYIPADLSDVPTATELNTTHGAGSWEGTTPANVADAVWDELEAGHTIAGSFGEEVTKQGKKLDRNLVWLLP